MKRVDSFHLLKERFGKWSKDPSPLFSADMFTPTYVGRRCVSASRRVVHKEYFFIGVRASGLKRKGVGGISSLSSWLCKVSSPSFCYSKIFPILWLIVGVHQVCPTASLGLECSLALGCQYSVPPHLDQEWVGSTIGGFRGLLLVGNFSC